MMMMSKFVSAIQTSLAPSLYGVLRTPDYDQNIRDFSKPDNLARRAARPRDENHARDSCGLVQLLLRAGWNDPSLFPISLTLTQSRLRWAGFNFNVEERDTEGQTYEILAICRTLALARGCDRGEANRPVHDPEQDSRTRVVRRHPLDQRASRGFPIGQYALAGLRPSLRTDKKVSVWRVVMLNVRRLLNDSIAAPRDDETNYKVARDVVAVVDEVQQIDLAMIHIHEKFEEDADERADYQDLEKRRLNRLEFLAETRSQSRRDIVAKARLLLSSQLISDYEMHCAVANSLARDVLDPE
jgi:hypothetical protein